MTTSIAIIGASGAVGSELASQILRAKLLEPFDRLQLVGHHASASRSKLLGARIDLLDAFDDERVEIEMVPEIADVDAEIVIVASGVTMSAECKSRRDMGLANRPIFERIADECARRVSDALFIMVSNPIELAVEIFSHRLRRNRVFGMGAQQDSLRFARAIARDLGISRRHVHASVLGEHGQEMVPVWSSVELHEHKLQTAFDTLYARSRAVPLRERVASLEAEVLEHLQAERIPEAYEATMRALPDARIVVEPFITAHCLHSTPNATCNAVLHCLAAVLAEDGRRLNAQVLLENETLSIAGVCGVPIRLDHEGWHCDPLENQLTDEELTALMHSVNSIKEFNTAVLSHS
jgi:malate dehydrogenase